LKSGADGAVWFEMSRCAEVVMKKRKMLWADELKKDVVS